MIKINIKYNSEVYISNREYIHARARLFNYNIYIIML